MFKLKFITLLLILTSCSNQIKSIVPKQIWFETEYKNNVIDSYNNVIATTYAFDIDGDLKTDIKLWYIFVNSKIDSIINLSKNYISKKPYKIQFFKSGNILPFREEYDWNTDGKIDQIWLYEENSNVLLKRVIL